ncbi:hypothetical protein [Endozoicomonas sp. ALE010]|uniref:hypothetical protein n=1 Tax=Endozoicomonas sp. ALE010 TaxID=3403081 RepID=UPI003BB67794
MHRIDGDGATSDNRFTSGNPQAGIPATVITPEWLNSIQEELVSVIGAEKLDKSLSNQLLIAINRLIKNNSAAYQPGDLVLWTSGEDRDGVLDLTGARVANGWNDYHELANSGSTLITRDGDDMILTDLRGEFFRIWDNGRGVDPSRLLGSWQKGSYIPGDDAFADNLVFAYRSNYAGFGWDRFLDTTDINSGDIRYDSNRGTDLSVPEAIHHGGMARPRNFSIRAGVKY